MAIKYEHIISINLKVVTDKETKPSTQEIENSLNSFLKENKDDLSDAVEWVDTERTEEN